MTIIWLTVVVGVFNICLGFALGIYMQGLRDVSPHGGEHDDVFAPYDPSVDDDGDAASFMAESK